MNLSDRDAGLGRGPSPERVARDGASREFTDAVNRLHEISEIAAVECKRASAAQSRAAEMGIQLSAQLPAPMEAFRKELDGLPMPRVLTASARRRS